MIRPEITSYLKNLRYNWLEAASFLLVAGLGLTLAAKGWRLGGWLTVAAGLSLALVALAFLFIVMRAAMLRQSPTVNGVVEVTERRISFLAPVGGVIVDLDDVTRIDIITTDAGPFAPDIFWAFTIQGQQPAMIPTAARGAGDILDAVDGLPGASMMMAVVAMGSTEPAVFPIWQAPLDKPDTPLM